MTLPAATPVEPAKRATAGRPPPSVIAVDRGTARRLWLRAQRLDTAAPFGEGPAATQAAVEHLGYVQIDTINVIERCHHHILWSRIPAYRRADLHQAQSVDRSVFEYWTHALAYVPTRDLPYFLPEMKRHRQAPSPWFAVVTKADLAKVLALVRDSGPLSIRDIDDDVLVEKDHPWASRKPSKRALQRAFFDGRLTVAARSGMVKSYDLIERHFGWAEPPKPASEARIIDYLLDRALAAQGLVSLDSICHLDAPRKAAVAAAIEARVLRRRLRPVTVAGAPHWATPATLESAPEAAADLVHILSPFDPLIIQRKRLKHFFDYDHRFEAYLPRERRVHGYFALPVLVGDAVVAAIDLKTDRAAGRLLIQRWTWVGTGSDACHRAAIEAELDRFERFQLQA